MTLTLTADVVSADTGVPKPSSLVALLSGLAALRAVRRRRGHDARY